MIFPCNAKTQLSCQAGQVPLAFSLPEILYAALLVVCSNSVHVSSLTRNLHINGIDELIVFLGSNPDEVRKWSCLTEWGKKFLMTDQSVDKGHCISVYLC